MQHTLSSTISYSGTTLHRGLHTTVKMHPASAHTGRIFVRTDLPGCPEIPARAEYVQSTALSTALVAHGVEVQTPEHLLSALYALGIDNCRIEIDGPEIPILDGSAVGYIAYLEMALTEQCAERATYKIATPITVYDRDSWVSAIPSTEPGLRLSYAIDFPHPLIGKQWHSFVCTPQTFAQEIAPARTFTLQSYVDAMRAKGLIQGGSLDCALVLGDEGWLEAPTWENEPVRHKLLDLVGDLSLSGLVLEGHIVAYKAGHTLHGQLAKKLYSEYEKHHGLSAPHSV
jgi:UDP-3-O-[3-hydroxymyristoyl] N-acetylglucosamine deacetylase